MIPVGDEYMDINMFENIFCIAVKVFYVNDQFLQLLKLCT